MAASPTPGAARPLSAARLQWLSAPAKPPPWLPADSLAPMTDVYVDASLASGPGAVDHLAHLVDAGQRLIFIGTGAGAVVATFADAPTVERLPDDAVRGSWFVTAEPARCADRPAGVRSLLIGPRPDRAPVHGRRCDADARDLAAAVLEILAHDAMGT